MTAGLINFDASAFSIQEDPELELEDNRLDQELKQLIAEQFDDFDLGEDKDDDLIVASDEQKAEISDANQDDWASILAAGKLSLLEEAIRGLAGSDAQISERTGSGQDTSANATGSPFDVNVHCANSEVHSNPSFNQHNIDTNMPVASADASVRRDVHPDLPCTTVQHYLQDNVLYNISEPSRWEGDSQNPCYHEHGVSYGQEFRSSLPPPPEISAFPPDLEVTSNTSHTLFPSSTSHYEDPQKRFTNGISTALTEVTPFSQFQHSNNLVEETSAENPTVPTPPSPQSIRELLYAARGHQLQQLNAELRRIQEEAARDKRVAAHRLMLAEDEKQALSSKLASTDANVENLRLELGYRDEEIEKLKQQLAEKQHANDELTTELSALRSTNESLSSQLVELTKGDAIRRVEEREERLTEALERRYAVASNSLQTELQAVKQKLQDTEQELRETARQLEATKSDAAKARCEFHESTIRSTKQLEELQSHCQKLASSALCSEVTTLRQKVSELETAKKISEDVNQILQEELHDLREQVDMYESVLNLDQAGARDALLDMEVRQSNQSSPLPGVVIPNGRRHGSIDQMVTFATELGGCRPQTAPRRPASAVEHTTVRDARGGEEFSRLYDDDIASMNTPKQTRFEARSRTPKIMSETKGDQYRPLSHHGIVTSTPSSTALFGRLRAELNRCLSQYKAKREQVTQLHEAVFTTRCQLHQAVENAKQMEKNASGLQDRVLSLERDLAAARELNEAPGPRESVLQGQLERLKSDYTKLEEELQTTRTRLQTALGAEARALEAEKATAERLSASVAERDAAVERTRAVCDAHFSALRRQMEMNWASERENSARHTEELLDRLKKEAADRDAEVGRLTKLCQEAEQATQKAVENALYEAMQEREAERIRFWREELPNQLKIARLNWEQEGNERSAAAVHDAVQAYKAHLSKEQPKQISRDFAVQIIPMTKDVQTSPEARLIDSESTQTEMPALMESGSLSIPFVVPHALLDILGPDGFTRLRLHLLESPLLSIVWLDQQICAYFRILFSEWWRHTWNGLNEVLCEYGRIYQIPVFLPGQDVRIDLLPTIKDMLAQSSKFTPPSWLMEEDGTTVMELDKSRLQFLLQLQRLCAYAVESREKEVAVKVPATQTVDPQSVQQLYFAAVQKIKQDVMDYVHTCQTRAAQILNSQLGRVHRRACRHFATLLRQALCDAGYQVTTSSLTAVSPTRHPNGLPRSSSPVPRPRTPRTSTPVAGHLNVVDEASLDAPRKTQATSIDMEPLLQMIDNVSTKLEAILPRSDSLGSSQSQPLELLNKMMNNLSMLGQPTNSISTGDTLLSRGHSDTDPSETLCPIEQSRELNHHSKRERRLKSTALCSLGDTHSDKEAIVEHHSPLFKDNIKSIDLVWEVCCIESPVALIPLKGSQTGLHSSQQNPAIMSSTAPLIMRQRDKWDTVGPPTPSLRPLRTILSVDSLEITQPPITARSRICRLPESQPPTRKPSKHREKGSRNKVPIMLANYRFARQETLPRLPLFEASKTSTR